MQVFKQFFYNRRKNFGNGKIGGNSSSILEFKSTTLVTGYNLFKRSFNSDYSLSTPTDLEGAPAINEDESDGEDLPKSRHDAMVDFSNKVNKAWAELSDERKKIWNEEAAQINDSNNEHKHEHCFRYVPHAP